MRDMLANQLLKREQWRGRGTLSESPSFWIASMLALSYTFPLHSFIGPRNYKLAKIVHKTIFHAGWIHGRYCTKFEQVNDSFKQTGK